MALIQKLIMAYDYDYVFFNTALETSTPQTVKNACHSIAQPLLIIDSLALITLGFLSV